ncbi:MAG: glycosyltransferase family 2 protein [Armatimonadetes bacterium]|nr:glycosyltransferase family 2 protein [Armatimonadota bacterium]
MTPSLSILIVNWNTRYLLDACLASLRSDPVGRESEIIVVDNASHDASAEMVREKYPWVELVANDENVGYACGNNQAAQSASGDYCLLLNPDTEVTDGALSLMLEFMESHPDVGAVGCKLVHPDGQVQQSVRTFPSPDVALYEALQLSRLFPRHRTFGKYRMGWWNYDDVREVDQPMASCLMLRRKALEQVGMMDEQFPIFFNDVDLCYRLKQAGWKIYFLPDAVVIHHGGQSTRQVRREMIAESHRAMLRFYRKHYRGKVNRLLYVAAVTSIGVGMYLRMLGKKYTR